jgi:hypothetical protein
MKYTEEELKKVLLKSLEKLGYYSEANDQEDHSSNREEHQYHMGRYHALAEVYGVENFFYTPEAVIAYNKGVSKYKNEYGDC